MDRDRSRRRGCGCVVGHRRRNWRQCQGLIGDVHDVELELLRICWREPQCAGWAGSRYIRGSFGRKRKHRGIIADFGGAGVVEKAGDVRTERVRSMRALREKTSECSRVTDRSVPVSRPIATRDQRRG